MRVIAGQFRSRLLTTPPGTGTRPTSDRLRETLFNILGSRVAGSRFTDLYAGSGAVGIEAISRGAAQVYFAENSRSAAASIRANLQSLNVQTGYVIETGGTAMLLKQLQAESTPLDLFFLDPPYEAASEYSRTLTTLGAATPGLLLHADALVIAEHARKLPLLSGYGNLRCTRTLIQGDAALSFFAPTTPGQDRHV